MFESDHAWGLTEGLLQHPVSFMVLLGSGRRSAYLKLASEASNRSLLRRSKWTYQNLSTMVSLWLLQAPARERLNSCINRETLPTELQPVLLQQMLNLTSQAASPDSPYKNENSIVLRKLFSSVSHAVNLGGSARTFADGAAILAQLASLILRLAPKQWSNPLLVVVTTLAGHRVEKALIFEWLEIAIRDIQRGALIEPRK